MPLQPPSRPAPRNAAVLLDTGTLRLKHTAHGLVLYPAHDLFVGRSLDLYGEWSADDAAVVAPFVPEGGTVLDVGANIGTFALSMARLVGPQGRVVAFEPVAASFRLLVANLALNDAAQVEARHEAVGATRGQTRVPVLDFAREGNYGASALDSEGNGEPVPVMAIDDLGLTSCNLLKADVEGHELRVLEGAAGTIRRLRPALFLENEEPDLSRALIDRLHAWNYRLWWHAPPLFRPDNWFGCPVDHFPTFGSLNVLALPAERALAPASALVAVEGASDWPGWWPDWSRQG